MGSNAKIGKIFIASDHAGYSMKKFLIENSRYNLIDLGAYSSASVDYNEYAQKLVEKVKADDAMGILICKTGVGMSIAANRNAGIRAALCGDIETARLARQHNDANILVLSAAAPKALQIIQEFFSTEFSGEERHHRRIKKLA